MNGLDERQANRDRALALVWAGMVLGVSFVATPAKFLAPSLSRPVALDVGRHTFRTFGRLETALAALLGITAPVRLLTLAPGAMVLAQALWLRPRLATRTQRVIEGGTAPASPSLHAAYVISESAKLAALLTLGLKRPGPSRRR